MAHLGAIVRHPIKSLGYEPLTKTLLDPGYGPAHDRRWAVAHAAAKFPDRPAEGWAPKLNFVGGWGSPALMAVRSTLDEASGRVTLSHPSRPTAGFRLDDPAEAAALIDWVAPLWPEVRPKPRNVVTVPGRAMTDVPEPWVAVLNLASNRNLEERMGTDLSIHRWRGNLWIDGLAAWAECRLIGREIAIGPVRLRVEEPITRCRATMANPETGQEDADTLAALEAAFGHREFGIYARVLTAGTVRCGDAVEVA